MVPYEAKLVGHEALAATIAAASVVGASLAGPIGTPFVELGSAALTGAIAAHAIGDAKRVRRAAHRAAMRADAPLAAHAIQLGLRAKKGEARALRSAATLVGRLASDHLGAIVANVTLGWSNPLRALATTFEPKREVAA